MKIFCDYHHDSLYHSLHMLLETRLGHELYRPIGMDWFENGYWEIAKPYGNDPRTAAQYLDVNNNSWDSFTNLNGNYKLEDGVYHVNHPLYNYHQKAVTLDQFKQMDFDIMIASYIDHIIPYANLITGIKPNTKLVHQMGNNWKHRVKFSHVKNIMASTAAFGVPHDVKPIFYHQEFPLDIFNYEEPKQTNKITSFVNCLPRPELFARMKTILNTYQFKSHGASCPDDSLGGMVNIANEMKECMFGYHFKPGADGYGHILHNWFAVGRPVIINYDEYRNTLGGDLLIPDVTCINFNGNNIEEVCDKIRHFSQPDEHKAMCERVHAKFKEKVDFDKDATNINEFLHNLN